jgi:hypothetical protein
MNKETQTTPAQPVELFRLMKNYCWLTGFTYTQSYFENRDTKRKKKEPKKN